jgi:hypothetical protein
MDKGHRLFGFLYGSQGRIQEDLGNSWSVSNIFPILKFHGLLRSVMTNQTLNPWYSTKLVVFLRSSAVPQSLVFRAVGSGQQKCCQLDVLGQSAEYVQASAR